MFLKCEKYVLYNTGKCAETAINMLSVNILAYHSIGSHGPWFTHRERHFDALRTFSVSFFHQITKTQPYLYFQYFI